MELRDLKTFLQVASMHSFTLAGKALGYSQSNISAQISKLEREVGAPLFDRIGHRISLTQYGEALLPYARDTVALSAKTENFLRGEDTIVGTVRVGMVESIFETVFLPVAEHYHRRFPKVHLEICVDAASSLQNKLRQNQIDLACLIDDPFPEQEWKCWYSREVSIVIVANPVCGLCREHPVRLEDVAEREMILMEDASPYSAYFQQLMAKRRLEYRAFIRLQSPDMARKMVEHGDYLAVLPDYSVKKAVVEGRVRLLSVDGFSQNQTVQLVIHRSKAITPQINGFLEEIRSSIEENYDGIQ